MTPSKGRDMPLRLKILLADGPTEAVAVRQMLAEESEASFDLIHVELLSEALDLLSVSGIDLVLLDLNLADCSGAETFAKVCAYRPDLPIVVLTGSDDQDMARKMVYEGAQDYLVRGHFDGPQLIRAIHYAVERNRRRKELVMHSLSDELTGLHNRRGFMVLAEHHRRLARRSQKKCALVFADVDDLKRINDTFGHAEGDYAIRKIAEILRKTFRDSDIVARLGGDEFTILTFESTPASSTITERLQQHLIDYNEQSKRGYQLSMGIGIAQFDPQDGRSVDQILAEADEMMYEQKRKRRNRVQGAA
jgi:two-component system cell cycle response regulator